jgi:transcriptional regulator with XRE-family HTH domain
MTDLGHGGQMEVGREIRRLREARGWSQAKLAGDTGMGVSGISQIETGARNPSAVTLWKIAGALGVEVGDLFPKAQSPLPFEEASGRSPEERIETSNSLAKAVETLSITYRRALEGLAGAPADDIGGLYLQASLIHAGAEAVAEHAGYSIDAEGDSVAEREAKRKMCDALDKMDRIVDEIWQAMTAAEAEQDLPEGVVSLTRYQRRRAG